MTSLIALTVLTSLAAGAGFDLTTVADRSQMTRTGRLKEVAVVCERLRGSGQSCEVFGTSPEGRPLHAYTLRADDGVTPKPVVLVIAGIHAGEIDGKDAIFTVVEELMNKRHPGVLEAADWVFVPVYNVDGHERFGPNHRPNQRGPEEMGWRVTAQNYNLNRDWTKADAPETRAMLALIAQKNPALIVDLHVTDGAKFRHDIAVLTEPFVDDGSNTALLAPAKRLATQMQTHLKKTKHFPVDFYPAFEIDDDPTSGFSRGVTPGRFTHGYANLRGRLGVLVETHSWQPYKARVQATVDLLHGVFDAARTDARAWQKAAVDVDAARNALVGKKIHLTFDSDPASKKTIDFLGYHYTRTPSAVSGGLWTQYDERKPETWRIPLVDDVVPAVTVSAPAAYAVLPGFAGEVAPILRAHGIRFHTVQAEVDGVVGERFPTGAKTFGATPYEGRQTLRVDGAWEPVRTHLSVGTLVVPVAQPGARIVMELMEPMARESATAWGFFNRRFEQKEYMEDYVVEVEARRMMAKDPALARAFEARLVADAAFRADPQARLRFFYERHPAFDAVYGVVPVLRLLRWPGALPPVPG